jgi:hypothetical protein
LGTVKPLRAILLLGVIAALATAGALAATPAVAPAGAPVAAGAVGKDVVVLRYPALVNKRLVRTRKLLDAAAQYQDIGETGTAVRSLAAVRSNLRKAWDGAKFVIESAPRSGDSSSADRYALAAAVLTLQHEVVTTAIAMMDTASPPLLAAVNTSLFAALNQRDIAVEYIHSLPAPAGARAPAVLSAAMRSVLVDLDDELLQVDGVRALTNLSPGRKRLLDLTELQDSNSGRRINRYWPLSAADN